VWRAMHFSHWIIPTALFLPLRQTVAEFAFDQLLWSIVIKERRKDTEQWLTFFRENNIEFIPAQLTYIKKILDSHMDNLKIELDRILGIMNS
jgi:hypothetical protein